MPSSHLLPNWLSSEAREGPPPVYEPMDFRGRYDGAARLGPHRYSSSPKWFRTALEVREVALPCLDAFVIRSHDRRGPVNIGMTTNPTAEMGSAATFGSVP